MFVGLNQTKIFIFKFMFIFMVLNNIILKKVLINIFVRKRFLAQTQDVWDVGLVSLVQ